jgi:hypothetical protein
LIRTWKIFDVTLVEQPKESKLPVVVNYNEPDMKQDLTDAYQQSKENLQELIEQERSRCEILQVAKARQHSRAFEVYGLY